MQKKILLILFTCLIVSGVSAQINKGAVLLGGSIGFSTGNSSNSGTPDSKSTSITISPAYGKAIRDNLVIGADINFGYNKNETINSYTQKTNIYGAGFFVRKYKALGKGFYLFGQTRAGMNYSQTNYNSVIAQNTGSTETKSLVTQIAFYPGVSFAVNKKLQLEAGFNNLAYINFTHSESTSSSAGVVYTSKSNDFSLGSNLSSFSGFTVGFRVLLN